MQSRSQAIAPPQPQNEGPRSRWRRPQDLQGTWTATLMRAPWPWPCRARPRSHHHLHDRDGRNHDDRTEEHADHASAVLVRKCTISCTTAPFGATVPIRHYSYADVPKRHSSHRKKDREAQMLLEPHAGRREPARGRLWPPRTRPQASWRRSLKVERGRSRGHFDKLHYRKPTTGQRLTGTLRSHQAQTTRGRGSRPRSVADPPSPSVHLWPGHLELSPALEPGLARPVPVAGGQTDPLSVPAAGGRVERWGPPLPCTPPSGISILRLMAVWSRFLWTGALQGSASMPDSPPACRGPGQGGLRPRVSKKIRCWGAGFMALSARARGELEARG
jgi:hypothetical protein